jgi:peptidoglycan/xylan/chitin deacetylase (PgdA/CDA1 family)
MNEQKWRPAPAIQLSVVMLVAALLVLALRPALWPWALGVVAGTLLLLTAAVFWPRTQILGPNLVRLPATAAARNEVCLTFDDGPDPDVTLRVLDMLDRHHARASFFCVGEKAAAHREIVREIARRGHSVENHSQRHCHAFALYGMGSLRREVEEAQAVIARITGRTPEFFRAPVGLRSPLLDPVLPGLGLRYVSWTRRGFDTVDGNAAAVLRRLTRGLAAGDVLLLHDGARARTREGEAVVLAVLPGLLERLAAAGLKSVPLPVACGGGTTD